MSKVLPLSSKKVVKALENLVLDRYGKRVALFSWNILMEE